MTATFLARQPIVDRDRRVHAYEILFRGSANAVSCEEKDGDRATASVVLSSITGLGLDRITTGRLAFINCTERVLMLEGLHQVLHPKTTVLEVLENVEPRPLIISGLRTLAMQGYRIALDDFTYRPELEPFLD